MDFDIHLSMGLPFYGTLILRLVIAAGCGALIGYERKRNFKMAGLRTHILVCCGAALFMILSKYAFADSSVLTAMGAGTADPARIAAQVVSGIGFLGVGVIFKHGGSIKGLTTAAGMWMTAGVGMAIGAGMILIGVFAAVFILFLQLFLHKQSLGAISFSSLSIKIITDSPEKAGTIIKHIQDDSKSAIISCSINRIPDHLLEYALILRAPNNIAHQTIEKLIDEHEEIVSAEIVS